MTAGRAKRLALHGATQHQTHKEDNMDIRCPECGEPWDHDTLHEMADYFGSTYQAMAESFRIRGCAAFDERHADTKANPAIGALAELAGDDMDGFASDLEDFMAMGLLDPYE